MKTVYCLSETSGRVIYVGVTSMPLSERLRFHLIDRNVPEKTKALRDLHENDRLLVEVIEDVSDQDALEAEDFWVRLFRSFGFSLDLVKNFGKGGSREKRVKCLSTGEVFDSIKSACRKYGGDPRNLRECLKPGGRQSTFCGKRWAFMNEQS